MEYNKENKDEITSILEDWKEEGKKYQDILSLDNDADKVEEESVSKDENHPIEETDSDNNIFSSSDTIIQEYQELKASIASNTLSQEEIIIKIDSLKAKIENASEGHAGLLAHDIDMDRFIIVKYHDIYVEIVNIKKDICGKVLCDQVRVFSKEIIDLANNNRYSSDDKKELLKAFAGEKERLSLMLENASSFLKTEEITKYQLMLDKAFEQLIKSTSNKSSVKANQDIVSLTKNDDLDNNDDIGLDGSLEVFFGDDELFETDDQKKRFQQIIKNHKKKKSSDVEFNDKKDKIEYAVDEDNYDIDETNDYKKQSPLDKIKNLFHRNRKKADYEDIDYEYDILDVDKPKNKKGLKAKIIAASSVLVVGIIALTSIAFHSCSKKPKVEPVEVTVSPTVSIRDDDPQKQPSRGKEEIPDSRVNKEPNKRKDIINLDNKVTVKEGTMIYSSAYDSVNNQNGQTPYYSYDSSNTVVGITLQSNKGLATLVETDDNTYEFISNGNITYLTKQEAIRTINNMTTKGWKKAGVAVRNVSAKSGVTGFYKTKSLK